MKQECEAHKERSECSYLLQFQKIFFIIKLAPILPYCIAVTKQNDDNF